MFPSHTDVSLSYLSPPSLSRSLCFILSLSQCNKISLDEGFLKSRRIHIKISVVDLLRRLDMDIWLYSQVVVSVAASRWLLLQLVCQSPQSCLSRSRSQGCWCLPGPCRHLSFTNSPSLGMRDGSCCLLCCVIPLSLCDSSLCTLSAYVHYSTLQ